MSHHTNDDFLKEEEIIVLTARRTKWLQIAQLREMRIAFSVDSLNELIVARSELDKISCDVGQK